MKIYAAARLLPHDEPTRELLTRSLYQFEELAMEGRRRLLERRDPYGSRVELSQALATVGLELSADSSTTFRAAKAGRLLALNAVAWDEIFSIAREAVGNALKHSNAPTLRRRFSMEHRPLPSKCEMMAVACARQRRRQPSRSGILG